MKLDRRTCDQWNSYDVNVLRLSKRRSRKRGKGLIAAQLSDCSACSCALPQKHPDDVIAKDRIY